MKKTFIAVAACAALFLAGCGKSLTVDTPQGQKTYETYGILNQDTKSDKVCYELSIGNTVWTAITIEGVILPIYFIGFSIMNPVRMKTSANDDCHGR